MPDRTERLEFVRRLVSRIDEEDVPAPAPWLSRMCLAASDVLPASGSGGSLWGYAVALVDAALSAALTRRRGELQFALGGGPCVDAFTDSRPVLVPDLGEPRPDRWPGYAPAATALGVRAVFSF